jgi:hypothetical protein
LVIGELIVAPGYKVAHAHYLFGMIQRINPETEMIAHVLTNIGTSLWELAVVSSEVSAKVANNGFQFT